MKRAIVGTVVALLVSACGGGGGSPASTPAPEQTVSLGDPDEVTAALTDKITIDGELATVVAGLPPSAQANAPGAEPPVTTVAPNSGTVAPGSSVEIPVTVSASQTLRAVFAKIPGAQAFFRVDLGNGKAAARSGKSEQIVNADIDVPDNFGSGTLCVEFSAQDVADAVSEPAVTCVEIRAGAAPTAGPPATPTPAPTQSPTPTPVPTVAPMPMPTPTPEPTPFANYEVPAAAAGDRTSGYPLRPNYAQSQYERQHVAVAPDGRFAVVDGYSNRGGSKLHLYDVRGQPVSAVIRYNDIPGQTFGSAGLLWYRTLSMFPDGSTVVVWVNTLESDQANERVFVSKYTATGQLVFGPIEVQQTAYHLTFDNGRGDRVSVAASIN